MPWLGGDGGRAGGQWRLAFACLREMRAMNVEPDEISYNAGISACEMSGYWNLAFSLVTDMFASFIRSSTISHISVICACVRSGQWLKALSSLLGLSIALMKPNVLSYSAGVNACEKGIQWYSLAVLVREVSTTAQDLFEWFVSCSALFRRKVLPLASSRRVLRGCAI